MNSQISVRHLSKFYEVHQKKPGFAGSLRAFFSRKYETIRAVEDVSFEIGEGEIVGFLGPIRDLSSFISNRRWSKGNRRRRGGAYRALIFETRARSLVTPAYNPPKCGNFLSFELENL